MNTKTPSIKTIARLLVELKKDIEDDYRCPDDPGDDTPGMLVTIGASTDGTWNYQTGENSYAGGAYGHQYWGLVYLYRDSNCQDLAREAIYEIADQMAEMEGSK